MRRNRRTARSRSGCASIQRDGNGPSTRGGMARRAKRPLARDRAGPAPTEAAGEAEDLQAAGTDSRAASTAATIAGLPDDLLLRFARSHTSQALLSAVIAWAITVAPAAFARGAPAGAQVLAVLSFLAGVGGPLLAVRRRR